MFVMISGQSQTIRTRRNNRHSRVLPDRNSPRPRKYWREVQEIPAAPVQQAETTGEVKQQQRPGPRKSEPRARPVQLEGGLSKVFKIPVPPQEPPAEETEDQPTSDQTEEEMTAEQTDAGEKRTKTQNNSKKTNTVSATSTEGMMWGMRQGRQGGDAAQQNEGVVDGSDALPHDEGFVEGESMEDVKSKGETQQYHQNPET